MYFILRRYFILLTALAIVACGGEDRTQKVQQIPPAPAPLAINEAPPMESEGVVWQVRAYEDAAQAQPFFGFDVRTAGLAPLGISIANRSPDAIKILPRQTFLVDADSQAWPLLTAAQARSRLASSGLPMDVPAALPSADELAALTGFALDLLAGPAFSTESNARPESRASRKFAEKNLSNPTIPPGQVASGVLYFPGQGEAKEARRLRLCYQQGAKVKCLVLPLKTAGGQ
jgi:hypothetical protein